MTSENIWNEYHQAIRSFVMSRVKDKDICEDLVQDIFEKIHTKMNQLQQEEKLESWIFAIARNRINDHFRQEKSKEKILEHEPIDTKDEPDKILQYQQCLLPHIQQLPSPYKKLIVEHQLKKVPQKELAKQLNSPYPTVRSQIQRARKMLKKRLIACCNPFWEAMDEVCSYC